MRVQKVFKLAEKLVREIEIEEPNIEVKEGKLTYKVSRQTIKIHLHGRRRRGGWIVTLNISPEQLPYSIKSNKVRIRRIRGRVMID